jgi:Flp pilus assembly pilin Flp
MRLNASSLKKLSFVKLRHTDTTKLQRSNYQRGASLVEYALLIGIIATVGILAIRSLGNTVSSQFSYTAGVIEGK